MRRAKSIMATASKVDIYVTIFHCEQCDTYKENLPAPLARPGPGPGPGPGLGWTGQMPGTGSFDCSSAVMSTPADWATSINAALLSLAASCFCATLAACRRCERLILISPGGH